MKYYTIASGSTVNCGHGSSVNIESIRKGDCYGVGEYPKLYKTRELAQAYIDSLDFKYGLKVAELKVSE